MEKATNAQYVQLPQLNGNTLRPMDTNGETTDQLVETSALLVNVDLEETKTTIAASSANDGTVMIVTVIIFID